MDSEKRNVLFVLPNFDTGGSEKLVVDIVKNIDKKKFNVVICVFFTGKYEQEINDLGIPFYCIHRDGILSKWQVAKFISSIVRKHDIHVVNTHHSSPLIQGVIPFKLLNRVFWIHTEHTCLNLDPNVTPKIEFIEKICLKFVDKSLGISQSVCDYFHEELKVPIDRIVKILNGVSVERFQLSDEEKIATRNKIKKELEIKEDDVIIGMCANFRKQKNHAVLIRACDLLIPEGVSNFKIVLCGTGPEMDTVKSLVTDLNLKKYVLFLGARLDIPELINVFDIYCLPSFFEGLPFSILEAMAASKPVVTTNVEGNKEVVKDQRNGLVVPSDDAENLAKALKKLIQDNVLRHRFGKNNLEDVKNLSFKKMLTQYEILFSTYLL